MTYSADSQRSSMNHENNLYSPDSHSNSLKSHLAVKMWHNQGRIHCFVCMLTQGLQGRLPPGFHYLENIANLSDAPFLQSYNNLSA